MNRIMVALFLLVVCILPSLAQQSGSNAQASSTQAAPAGPESIQEPIPAPTSNGFWDGDDPNLVNLVTHPFANKKYVQRLTGPIKDRLNELDEITASNSATIKDIDSRSQHGLQLASEKTSMADEHATDASNKAQTAQTAATQATTHVSNAEQMVANL